MGLSSVVGPRHEAIVESPSTEFAGREWQAVVTRDEVIGESRHKIDRQEASTDALAQERECGFAGDARFLRSLAGMAVVHHDSCRQHLAECKHAALAYVSISDDEASCVLGKGGHLRLLREFPMNQPFGPQHGLQAPVHCCPGRQLGQNDVGDQCSAIAHHCPERAEPTSFRKVA